MRYRLGTTVPENWVPFLPEHLPGSIQDIRFRRGEMPPHGTRRVPPRRRGVLLTELPAPFYVAEEEVPGSGIIVTRRVQRARWYDGRTYLWIGRARETGRGQAWSGLASTRSTTYRRRRDSGFGRRYDPEGAALRVGVQSVSSRRLDRLPWP